VVKAGYSPSHIAAAQKAFSGCRGHHRWAVDNHLVSTLDQEVGGSSPPPPATKFQVRAFSTLLRSTTLASEAGLGHWAHDQGQPQPRRDTVVEQRDRLAGHINLQAAATARAANRKLIAVAADLAVLPPGWGGGRTPPPERPPGWYARPRPTAGGATTNDRS
jgi:hypothetical protein